MGKARNGHILVTPRECGMKTRRPPGHSTHHPSFKFSERPSLNKISSDRARNSIVLSDFCLLASLHTRAHTPQKARKEGGRTKQGDI